MSKAEEHEREIVEYISNAAIELAFTRHELTTTDYEETDYPDVEEGVEAFKALVEDVKADVLACLTGDAESCLDPEDIDYDTELLWLKRKLARLEPHLVGEAEQKIITDATAWAKAINMRIGDDEPGEAEVAATSQLYESVMQLYSQKLSAPPKGEQS